MVAQLATTGNRPFSFLRFARAPTLRAAPSRQPFCGKRLPPVEPVDEGGEGPARRCSHRHLLAGRGMEEGELDGMEKQPVAAKFLPEEAVVAPLAVIRVTDDRVEQVLE